MKDTVPFVHLHVHSEYSLLDGSCRINGLVRKARDLGMPAVAVTDHGAMYGTVEFYKAARDAGIASIIGCEFYVAPRDRFSKTPKVDESPFHLVLLASDNEGYRNLMQLVSRANLEGFYYKPRIDKEILAQHSRGLIGLSACLQGEVAARLLKGTVEQAEKALHDYVDILGRENFFIEIMDHNLPEQKAVNPLLVDLARRSKIPLVATNDVHYMNREDSLAQEVQICIQTGKTLDDPNRLSFNSQEFYLKSGQEMKMVFPEFPEALSNTLEVASRCHVTLDFGTYHLPHFPEEGKTPESYLEELCHEGVKWRYSNPDDTLMKRMQYELGVIRDMGFATYFLIIWDFIRFARSNNIPVGPGRGSAAGSIVAYLLGITDVDPMRFGLLFERFLNPGRKSMPDVDTDFCVERRGEVIRYVTEIYGSDHVSQIVTFGRMKAKAAIRDCGRVLSIALPVVDRIAKLIPLNSTIEQALGTDEIKKIYQSEPQARQILDTAKVVEGLARNSSIHAAGVIISKDPLSFHVPLQRMGGDEVVAQYEMNSVSDIGLLKMDFLGLRNLTVIKNCLEMIRNNRGIEVSLDLAHLPLDDEKTYKLLQDAKTVGVFQLESSGMQGYLKQLRPDRFEDIVALCALYRPGPLGSGMVDDFIKGRHGRKKVEYLHSLLEPILKETYGVIIYQEQVMQIANVMADFSMAQADDLRKAMGKKKEEVMAKQEKAFMEGAKKKGIDLRIAKKIWELMVFFAGYGFNKSHTVAYAIVAYQTAYLKANYPLEYMAALMTSFMDKIDKLSFVVKECRTMGLNVLAPHINESEVEFSVKGDAIRFGLAGIKNVGRNAIESIIETRKRCGAFASIGQLCSDVDLRLVNKKVMESLAKSGAMDCLGETRATMMANLDYLLDCAGRIQKEKRSGQISLFEAAGCGADIQRIELTHRAPEYERESILAFEKEMLGLYISDHPLNSVRELLKEKVKNGLGELDHVPDGSLATCAGIINSIKRITTKKNQTMAFLAIEDFSGTAEVVVLPKVYEKAREYLVEDSIIIVKAKVEFKEKGADNSGGSDEDEARLEVKLLAEDIYPVEAIDAMETIRGQEEPKFAGCHIRVDCGKWEHLEQLKSVIQKSKGAVPVYLHLESPGGKTVIAVEKDFWILHTKDFKEIVENLMGAGTVWDQ